MQYFKTARSLIRQANEGKNQAEIVADKDHPLALPSKASIEGAEADLDLIKLNRWIEVLRAAKPRATSSDFGDVLAFQTLHEDASQKIAARTKSTTAKRAEYCLLYTSPSPRDQRGSRMPSSA